jgi:uncharacterized phage-associated protein
MGTAVAKKSGGSARETMRPVKFGFNERKALEALALIAELHPGFTPLYIAKILFFAEKWHLNRYGRPIIGDTYIAMPKGPVPSVIRDYLEGNWEWVDQPEDIDNAICIDRSGRLPRLLPGARPPQREYLSESDIECLTEAVDYCKSKSAGELSEITHFEKAWRLAPVNAPMDYLDFVDDENENSEQIIQEVIDNACCGVI